MIGIFIHIDSNSNGNGTISNSKQTTHKQEASSSEPTSNRQCSYHGKGWMTAAAVR